MLLASLTWGQFALCMGLIFLSCLLMLIILLQRGRGGGLASAFGGGGGGGAFGAKTGDVFTLITVILAAVFLMTAVGGVYLFTPKAVALPAPPSAVSTQPSSAGDKAPAPAPKSGEANVPATTPGNTGADSTTPATPASKPEGAAPAGTTPGSDAPAKGDESGTEKPPADER